VYHTLAVIDLIAQKQLPFIELGALRGPHGLDFVQGKVWFTAEAAKAIGSYDPIGGKIDWIMGTGQDRTHMLYVFPDGRRILTTNVSSATVTILEKTEARAGGPRDRRLGVGLRRVVLLRVGLGERVDHRVLHRVRRVETGSLR
jgi:hypothetical protein